jgi:hypothetical protein
MGPKIELGKKYRDKITGIVGVATQRIEYLHDQPQIGLEREGVDGDGHRHEIVWFAEPRLEDSGEPE